MRCSGTSGDVVHDGLEIPCVLMLFGDQKGNEKMKTLLDYSLAEANSQQPGPCKNSLLFAPRHKLANILIEEIHMGSELDDLVIYFVLEMIKCLCPKGWIAITAYSL